MISFEDLVTSVRASVRSDRDADLIEEGIRHGVVVDGIDEAITDVRAARGDEIAASLRARVAHDALDNFERQYRRTERRRSAVEAPREWTDAHVGLLFAYGYARALDRTRAESLIASATAALPAADLVNRALLVRFRARILAPFGDGPSEEEVTDVWRALDRFLLYKADRVRQCSVILEPIDDLDPIASFRGDPPETRVRPPNPLAGAGLETIRKAVSDVADGRVGETERYGLLRAAADALRIHPVADALGVLEEAMPGLATTSDRANTNAHLCMSVIAFMDPIILGVIGEPAWRPVRRAAA